MVLKRHLNFASVTVSLPRIDAAALHLEIHVVRFALRAAVCNHHRDTARIWVRVAPSLQGKGRLVISC